MAVSDYDKKYLSQEDQDRIASVTEAAENGTMSWDEAHNVAENIRSNASYSGGRRGDQYIDLTGGFGNDNSSLRVESDREVYSPAGGSYSPYSTSAYPAYEGSEWDGELDSLAHQLLDLTYEDWLQGDQYKALSDRYRQQGQMSMQDVLGQIAARTGGLASSYATTAANQQMNAWMSELENAAREMYGLERGYLTDNLQLAHQFAQDDYSKYLDGRELWNTDRNFEYNAWRDNVEDNRYTDAYTDEKLLAQAETMAAYGDFSGYKALGYTDEQIAMMRAAWDAANAPKVEAPKRNPAKDDNEDEPSGTAGGGSDYWLGDGTTSGGKSSLNWDQDEGVFTWNGQNYYTLDDLANAIDGADLTAEEKKALSKKFALFGFDIEIT